jgi:Fe-S cluster biosynthesis and repair protein YggX
VRTISTCVDHRETGFFSRFNFFTSAYERPNNEQSSKALIEFQKQEFPDFLGVLQFVKLVCSQGQNSFKLDLASDVAYSEWESTLTLQVNAKAFSPLDSEYRNILQKSEDNVLVFSLVFWFLEASLQNRVTSSFVLRERHLRAGILVWRYLVEQHFELIKVCISNGCSTVADENLLFIVENCGTMTCRDMYRSSGLNNTKFKAAVQILEKNKVGALKTVGNNRKFFVMNDRLSKQALDFLAKIGYKHTSATSGSTFTAPPEVNNVVNEEDSLLNLPVGDDPFENIEFHQTFFDTLFNSNQ